MWDLPGPGHEPVSPALAGGFLTTAPPGKPRTLSFKSTLLTLANKALCDLDPAYLIASSPPPLFLKLWLSAHFLGPPSLLPPQSFCICCSFCLGPPRDPVLYFHNPLTDWSSYSLVRLLIERVMKQGLSTLLTSVSPAPKRGPSAWQVLSKSC